MFISNSYEETGLRLLAISPIALRTAKTLWSFGCSKCSRVKIIEMQFYFVTENESAGSNSLTGVIATALCALNKRNLQMEAAAAGRRIGFMIMLAQNMSPSTSLMAQLEF